VCVHGLACVPAQPPGHPIVLCTRAMREEQYELMRKKGKQGWQLTGRAIRR
jgi:hypothetical protein